MKIPKKNESFNKFDLIVCLVLTLTIFNYNFSNFLEKKLKVVMVIDEKT